MQKAGEKLSFVEIDRLVDLAKRVAVLVDFVQSVLQVKKAGLDHDRPPSISGCWATP
jgi:hypothetical protein